MAALCIMELLPGQGNQAIRCKMEIADWDDCPVYEAITYAWGDPNDKVAVDVDERTVEVTRNLDSCLLHLRRSDRSRLLWADALGSGQVYITENPTHQDSQSDGICPPIVSNKVIFLS